MSSRRDDKTYGSTSRRSNEEIVQNLFPFRANEFLPSSLLLFARVHPAHSLIASRICLKIRFAWLVKYVKYKTLTDPLVSVFISLLYLFYFQLVKS